MAATFPVWLLSLILTLCGCFFLSNSSFQAFFGEEPEIDRKVLWTYLALLAVCLLTVVRLMNWPIMLLVVMLAVLILDRRGMLEADLMLLLLLSIFQTVIH